jgi:hypothetical protein
MATEPSGSSSIEARMSALEERFDEPINLVHLMAKRDVENDARNNELHLGGKNHTKPPPQQPKPEDHENQRTSEVDSKLEDLEERIRLISGLGSFGNTDFASMSWFLNMEVPYKFKAQDFVKYNGTSDPMIYLQMYCRKMARNAGNEPLLIQTFQDILTGQAAVWFSRLKKMTHWKELADIFLAWYGHNVHSALDRFNLQKMEKKSGESFQEYA